MPDRRPNPLQIASKLLARARARGPTEALQLRLRRVRDFVASSDQLVILARDTAPTAPAAAELVFREASAADAVAYARDIGTDSRATFTARLSDATRCFLVEADGRLVHATWMTTMAAWTREVGGYLRPPAGDAYVYESFTRADARGRGVYPFALGNIAATLHKRSIKRVWIGVESDNAPSLRAVAKAGFEPSFAISYRRSVGKLHVDAPNCRESAFDRLCFTKKL